MHMSRVEWALALLAPVVQLLLLYTIRKRKLHTSYRLFFNYVAFAFSSLVLLLAIGSLISDREYFYLYWTINAITMLLAFLVLYEVFVNAFRPFAALIDLGKMLFGWATAFLLIASLLTAFATIGTCSDKICAAILLVERSVQLMQCGLLLLFVLFENRLGLSWRNHGMCIVLGLGVSASLDLISVFVRGKYPTLGGELDTLGAAFYLANFLFWTVMFSLPQPERRTVQDSPARLIFQRWNDALVSYQKGDMTLASGPQESFIPSVERAVERVLARKMTH